MRDWLLLAECGPRRAFCRARAGPGLARLPQPGKDSTSATGMRTSCRASSYAMRSDGKEECRHGSR